MSWYSRCSWCEGPFNGVNYRRCTNMSFGDEFVHNPDPISNNETPNFSYPPLQPQTSSLDQLHCFHCKDPLEEGEHCQRCSCKRCGSGLSKGFCFIYASSDKNSSINAPNPNFFNDTLNVFTHPPQPQYETYSCELCGNDSHYGYDSPPRFLLESTFPLNETISQIPPTIAITPILPTEDPEDSLIMGDEDLSTIPERESDKFIKSSVENPVPIPSETEDTSRSDSEYDLSSCDDFSPIDVPEGKSGTLTLFSIQMMILPLVLENIENKDYYGSYLDEPNLLVTPPSDANEDECFNPGGDIDKIELLLHHDPSTLKMSVASILERYYDSEGDIIYLENLLTYDTIPSLLSEMFLDHEPKGLKVEPNDDDFKYMVKNFDPEIHEKTFSPTYVSLPFEDRHYLFFTSEDTIFNPDIFVLAPEASHQSGTFISFNVYPNILNESSMEISSSTRFNCNIMMIWGESSKTLAQKQALLGKQPVIALDFKDSRARGFVHRPLKLQSLT
nr:hypothetical protein [Tanacetum cinerariifolium]